MNKRAIGLCIAVLVWVLLCVPASAATRIALPDGGMTLELPDDFTVIHADNVEQMTAALAEYDVTVTETELKLTREHYQFLAISSAMRCTLFLTRQEDAVSRNVVDLITYEDKDTARRLLLGESLPAAATVREIERNGALFYRVDCGVTDGVGRIAYVTVMNGACYTLCVVDNAGTLNQNINALLDTVFASWDYTINAEEQRIQAFRDRSTAIVLWAALAAAVVMGGWLVRSLLRDLRARRMEADRRQNVPKKPRR